MFRSDRVQKLFYFTARNVKKRTKDLSGVRFHAAEASESGAAQQIEKQRLDIVVGIVSHNNACESAFFPQPAECVIAKFPTSKLDARAMSGAVVPRVEVKAMQRNAECVAQTRHKFGIAVALRSSEMKIAVGNLNIATQSTQSMEQSHGIGASADTREQSRIRAKRRKRAAHSRHDPAGSPDVC